MSTGERVYGPYTDGDSFRVVVLSATGERSSRRCATEKEANDLTQALRAAIAARTVEDAVKEYLEHFRDKGNRTGSLVTTEKRLRALLAPALPLPLASVTTAKAK